jgi:hypothetical protein
MKNYLRPFIYFLISVLIYSTLFFLYPRSTKLNDDQLYNIRVHNITYITTEKPNWSKEKQAEWVDKSIQEIKSSETRVGFYYGFGYFLSLIFLLLAWSSFNDKHFNRKNIRDTKDSTLRWLSRLDY